MNGADFEQTAREMATTWRTLVTVASVAVMAGGGAGTALSRYIAPDDQTVRRIVDTAVAAIPRPYIEEREAIRIRLDKLEARDRKLDDLVKEIGALREDLATIKGRLLGRTGRNGGAPADKES